MILVKEVASSIFFISPTNPGAIKLTKIGGMIIHALPANNFCGHGFWQFSPELFYELYSPENGRSVPFLRQILYSSDDSCARHSESGFEILIILSSVVIMRPTVDRMKISSKSSFVCFPSNGAGYKSECICF